MGCNPGLDPIQSKHWSDKLKLKVQACGFWNQGRTNLWLESKGLAGAVSGLEGAFTWSRGSTKLINWTELNQIAVSKLGLQVQRPDPGLGRQHLGPEIRRDIIRLMGVVWHFPHLNKAWSSACLPAFLPKTGPCRRCAPPGLFNTVFTTKLGVCWV